MNSLQTLEYFIDETAAYMEELSWAIREDSKYENNNVKFLSQDYDFNKELYDNLLKIKSIIEAQP